MIDSKLKAPLGFAALALSALLAGCAAGNVPSSASPGPADTELTTVRVAYVPSVSTFSVAVAEEMGFFRDNGLKVETTPSPALPTFLPGLGNQFDIVFATPVDFLVAGSRGVDVAGIAGLTVETPDYEVLQTVAGKDSGVSTIADLEGKTVAVPGLGGTLYVSLLWQLQEAGVDPESVTFVEVPMPNMLDWLQAGKADAVTAAEPFMGQILGAGHTALGDPYLAVADPALATFWAGNRDWVANNPQAAEGWRTAMQQAYEFIAQNEEEARTIMQSSLGLPEAAAQNTQLPKFDISLAVEQFEPWVKTLEDTGVLKPGEAPDLSTLLPAV